MHPISIILIIIIALLIVAGRAAAEATDKANEAIHDLFRQQVAERGGEMVTLTQIRGVRQYDPYVEYEVTFTGRSGKAYRTVAKYEVGSRKIYWEKSPSDWLASDVPLAVAPAFRVQGQGLDSPVARERLAAVRQLAQTSRLSQKNLTRLAQMAVEDEDPQVREETKAIVRRS